MNLSRVAVGIAVMLGGSLLQAAEPAVTAVDPVAGTLQQLVETLSAFDDTKAPAPENGKPRVRDKKESAAIVGTAAAIGSALGALIAKDDRGKGAAVGAAVGGIAGLIYDRMTATRKDPAAVKPEPGATPAAAPEPAVIEKKLL